MGYAHNPDPSAWAGDELDADFPLGDGTADTGATVHCPCCGEAVEIVLDPGSGAHQVYVAPQYVKDDYPQQLAVYNNPNGTTSYATGPLILRDKDGNIIPTQPDAYPVGSATR